MTGPATDRLPEDEAPRRLAGQNRIRLIGICFGIYSSVLVMAPLVMWMGVSREDLVKPERKQGAEGAKILP